MIAHRNNSKYSNIKTKHRSITETDFFRTIWSTSKNNNSKFDFPTNKHKPLTDFRKSENKTIFSTPNQLKMNTSRVRAHEWNVHTKRAIGPIKNSRTIRWGRCIIRTQSPDWRPCPGAVKTICFPAVSAIKINNACGIVSEKCTGFVYWVNDVDVSFVWNWTVFYY